MRITLYSTAKSSGSDWGGGGCHSRSGRSGEKKTVPARNRTQVVKPVTLLPGLLFIIFIFNAQQTIDLGRSNQRKCDTLST